jgi:hypothetical protein
MWKSVVGHKPNDNVLKPSGKAINDEDDWDTDPDFVVIKRSICFICGGRGQQTLDVLNVKKKLEHSKRKRAAMGFKNY